MSDSAVAVWCHGQAVTVPQGMFEPHGQPRTLARFVGPVQKAWRDALDARGISVLAWAPPYGAILQLPPELAPDSLRDFGFIAGAIGYDAGHCARDTPHASAAQRLAAGLPADFIDLVCFDGAARERVEAGLRAKGVAVLETSSVKLRVPVSRGRR